LASSGSNVTLTNGPTYSSSYNGYLTFDGTNDHANFAAGTVGSTVTVEMWAKYKSGGANMPFGWNRYSFYATGATGWGFNTRNSDIYGISNANVTSLGLLNNWKHYVFVMKSGGYSTNKLYINGSLQTLSQQTGAANNANAMFNSGNGRIATWRNDLLYLMPMDISVFRVYNSELSSGDVTQNYNVLSGCYP
jgi:hypothetical protein